MRFTRRRTSPTVCVLSLLLILAPHVAPARAQPAAPDSFAGKTITLSYGASPGGVLDLQAQLISRHLGAHIPGAPSVVSSAVPGAASKILARHMFSAARKDGSEIGLVFPGALLDPLLGEGASGYDPRRFTYLGGSHYEAPVCLLRNDAPAKDVDELFKTEAAFGGSAPGSPTYDFPMILKGVLGAKIKMIRGYPGGQEMALAMERGELNGTCGSWSQLRVRYPGVIKGDLPFRIVVHGDERADSDLGRSSVPSALTFARTTDERDALQFFLAQNAFAAPFLLPPDVDRSRRDALRRAFDETMRDPVLLEDAKRMNLDVEDQNGQSVEDGVGRLFAAPAAIVQRVKAALR